MNVWLGIIVVAAVWFVHLASSYFLAWADCATNQGGLMIARHLVTAVALAGTAAIASVSLRTASPAVTNASAHADADHPMEQSFMMRLTIALSSMFLFAVVLAGAANLFLAPCV